MKIYGFSSQGYTGVLVDVDCDIQRGLPSFTIVGLPDSAVKESRDRVRSALVAAGYEFPMRRILINLSPGGIPKLGSGFDCSIASALLHRSGQILGGRQNERWLFLGECRLDGSLRATGQDIPALLHPETGKFDAVVIPRGLVDELPAGLADKLCLLPCDNLKDLAQPPVVGRDGAYWSHARPDSVGNCRLCRQESSVPDRELSFLSSSVLHALSICAAGMHNLLIFGPPGSGKTSAVRLLEQLVPEAEHSLLVEQLRIHCRFGPGTGSQGQEALRVFREPHHSSSLEGILGGGRGAGPGEISMAHGGVLFLDESPEFHRNVLQSLREPMEQGWIQLSRAESRYRYPCQDIFAFSMNLCPCGNRGRADALCMCSEKQIQKYWSQMGGAMYDRIEIRCYLGGSSGTDPLLEEGSGTLSGLRSIDSCTGIWQAMNASILRARAVQHERFRNRSDIRFNSWAGWDSIQPAACATEQVREFARELAAKNFLSGRQNLHLWRLALSCRDGEPGSLEAYLANDGNYLEEKHFNRALSLLMPAHFAEYL